MMDAQYRDPHKELTAQRKLEGIEQETTVDEYVVRFRHIAIATGYSETDLIHRYITGLKPHIQKACFSVRPLPVAFNDWVEVSTSFQENFTMEAEYHEHKGRNNTPIYSPPPKKYSGNPAFIPKATLSKKTEGNPAKLGQGEPVDVNRQKLTCHHCG